KELNTFKVDCITKTHIVVENNNDFKDKEFLKYTNDTNPLFLGGGSNVLFTKNLTQPVVQIKTKGKEVKKENDKFMIIKIEAGENWDDFVKWSIEHNLIGLQNLAYIPGTVGATPIQNVGAYGVETKDFLVEVSVINIKDGTEITLTNKECKFGYRDSIKYNGHIDDKYLQYAGIKEMADNQNLSLNSLYKIIADIRKSKLPSIEKYGTCGSTFKNPQLPIDEYERLKEQFPDLPMYSTEIENIVKIPAAYILEKLGWKNKRVGDVGTWIYHPLIVTNYGNATGAEILSFIKDMQTDFKSKTNLDLETEINIV
ncbi:MAG: UDP-N-acetylenolpyruvoylglucosamine reductase, UDP-N-acetylmuramate dehydrogenase, partial [candidate division WS6 bacterium GW2011_GWC1_33_20]